MTAQRALVICHSVHEGAGRVGQRLRERGYENDPFVVVSDPVKPVSYTHFPAHEGYDLIVTMGAPWSVYDNESIGTWIDRELTLLRDAQAAGIPILGVCFGAQALAAALGGTVSRAPRPEIGWHYVETDVAWIKSGPWFQWHSDRFTLPKGATELARSTVAPQAFRHGRSLGVQFHPEVDCDIVHDWLDGRHRSDDEFAAAGADPALISARAAAIVEASLPAADLLVDGFLDFVASG
ncbi:MAG: gamma-glutamyl-gamma-aminobutyrate hydrolase family protein [Acidimicrobiales bacterium]